MYFGSHFLQDLPKRCELWRTLQMKSRYTHSVYTAWKITKNKLEDELHNRESRSSLDRACLGLMMRLLAVDLRQVTVATCTIFTSP